MAFSSSVMSSTQSGYVNFATPGVYAAWPGLNLYSSARLWWSARHGNAPWMHASQNRMASPFFALTSVTRSAYLSSEQIERGVGRFALCEPWTTAQPPADREHQHGVQRHTEWHSQH